MAVLTHKAALTMVANISRLLDPALEAIPECNRLSNKATELQDEISGEVSIFSELGQGMTPAQVQVLDQKIQTLLNVLGAADDADDSRHTLSLIDHAISNPNAVLYSKNTRMSCNG